MYYIERKGNDLIKYEVHLDVQKLRDLKFEIIRNCGEVIPYHYQSSSCQVNPFDLEHVSDYSKKFIKWYKPNDFYSSSEKIYEYSYQKYLDTKLSHLIACLLNGDTSVIYEIENPIIEDKSLESIVNPTEKIQNYLKQDLSEINSTDLAKLEEERKNYQNYKELNRDRKSEQGYYPLVLACIDLEEVERMSIDKLQERECLLEQISLLEEQADKILEEVRPFFGESVQEEQFIRSKVKKEE